MLGNCATGRVRMVMPPQITITMEITMATIGRLIKNFDMELPSWSCQREWLGIHLHSRTDFLNALGHHALAGLQSILNNPLCTDAIADSDGPNAYFVRAIHHRHLIAALQLRDRPLRNAKRDLL